MFIFLIALITIVCPILYFTLIKTSEKIKYVIILMLLIIIFAILNDIGLNKLIGIIENKATPKKIASDVSANLPIIKIKDNVLLDEPVFKQFPELPRGCEVTSLAMLLNTSGINVNKMTLAKEIKRDKTPLRMKDGQIYYGDPNEGFIGNMYTYNKPGYGVYNKPIQTLAEQYLPDQIINLSGKKFEELQIYLSLGVPIWVITNTQFKKLPDSYFELWKTPNGDVKITYKEHSVLVTGYDDTYIYFNDPISGKKNKKVNKKDFMEAWKQMGSQAITYLPKETEL